jgi:hypothetical protein
MTRRIVVAMSLAFACATAMSLYTVSSAEARPRHHHARSHHHHAGQHHVRGHRVRSARSYRSARSVRYARSHRSARGYRYARAERAAYRANMQFAGLRMGGDARPSRWCGWYLRQRLGVGDRSFNLARNWARYGRPAGPQTGAIVVWRGHVGLITRSIDHGRAVVLSGNDGGRVRERERSLRGAIAFRMP